MNDNGEKEDHVALLLFLLRLLRVYPIRHPQALNSSLLRSPLLVVQDFALLVVVLVVVVAGPAVLLLLVPRKEYPLD